MVILFAGKAGAGKDTSAALVQKYLPEAQTCAFAKRVKEIARAFGWDGKKDEKGRKLLQSVGRVGREYQKDFWANDCVRQISEAKGHALVTDLRFQNELAVVRNSYPEAKLVLVTGRASDLGKNAGDISEHDLDGFPNFDYFLHNIGSIEDLESQIRQMLKSWDLI